MSTADTNELADILSRIKTWSPPERITLARRILETLETPEFRSAGNRPTIGEPTRGWPLESVIGLLKTDREPPDDEECRRIVEEERWKKHGS
jgi:hypothetical protein